MNVLRHHENLNFDRISLRGGINMMQAIKKLYNFVQQNLFCKIVTYFLVFAPIVICMEKGTSVKKGYINCINIFLVGVLILTYYSFLKDRHYYKQPLIYIFSGIIVFNRLYDIEAIGKKWNYSENILMIAGLVIVSAVLFLPEMGIFLCKKWKKKEFNQEQLSVADLTEDGNLIHENKNQHTERMSNDKKTEEKKQYKNVNMMNDSEKNKAETDKMPLFLTAVIMLIMIIVPSGIYYYIVQGDVFSIVQKFKDQNISSNLISSIVSYIILVFIVGTYSILLIKIIQLMVGLIRGKKAAKNELMLWFSVLLVIIYLYKEDSKFSQDSTLALFLQGDVFSFPLALAIAVPIITFFLSSLLDVLNEKENIKKNIVKQLEIIVNGIIDSLLRLIKFVTIDFLQAMLSLLEIENLKTDSDNQENREDIE